MNKYVWHVNRVGQYLTGSRRCSPGNSAGAVGDCAASPRPATPPLVGPLEPNERGLCRRRGCSPRRDWIGSVRSRNRFPPCLSPLCLYLQEMGRCYWHLGGRSVWRLRSLSWYSFLGHLGIQPISSTEWFALITASFWYNIADLAESRLWSWVSVYPHV